jgi:hypothetical protein
MDFDGTPAIEIDAVRPKRRDLELKFFFEHHDYAEMRADCIRPWKEFLHDLWPRVRGDVEVFRSLAPQQIAHTTAGEVSDVPGGAEPLCCGTRGMFHG